MNKKIKEQIIPMIVLLALGYLAVTLQIYRFSNPKQTETELFLNLPYAVSLQWDKSF